jgi:hypothetical protein
LFAGRPGGPSFSRRGTRVALSHCAGVRWTTGKKKAGKWNLGISGKLQEEKALPWQEAIFLDILPGYCYMWYRINKTGSLESWRLTCSSFLLLIRFRIETFHGS